MVGNFWTRNILRMQRAFPRICCGDEHEKGACVCSLAGMPVVPRRAVSRAALHRRLPHAQSSRSPPVSKFFPCPPWWGWLFPIGQRQGYGCRRARARHRCSPSHWLAGRGPKCCGRTQAPRKAVAGGEGAATAEAAGGSCTIAVHTL